MSVGWLEPGWPAPVGVRALSTFRSGGMSVARHASLNLGGHVGDLRGAVAENRRRLRAAAGLPAEPVWLNQVHGTYVVDLDAGEDREAAGTHGTAADLYADALGAAANLDAAAELHAKALGGAVGLNNTAADDGDGAQGLRPADAAFTRRRGRVCAILTADCLPLLFAADSGDRVAAAHAGWRGLAGGVIEATVKALRIAPERLMAWLGPAIGPGHFEIGAEVREALLRGDSGAEAAFMPNTRGRFMADLWLLARRRLAALGVERVYGGGQCTFGQAERYFSHRRDGVTGRQATLIWLD